MSSFVLFDDELVIKELPVPAHSISYERRRYVDARGTCCTVSDRFKENNNVAYVDLN